MIATCSLVYTTRRDADIPKKDGSDVHSGAAVLLFKELDNRQPRLIEYTSATKGHVLHLIERLNFGHDIILV